MKIPIIIYIITSYATGMAIAEKDTFFYIFGIILCLLWGWKICKKNWRSKTNDKILMPRL